MSVFIYYLLKTGLGIAGFYGLYHFLFRKEKQFVFNRFYLLSAFIAGFLLPMLIIRLPGNVLPYTGTPVPGSTARVSQAITVIAGSRDITGYLLSTVLCIYLSVCLLLVLRLAWGYFVIYRIIRKSYRQVICGQEVYVTTTELTPFSFLRKVVIPAGLLNSADLPAIIEHEKVHIRQLHSIDLLVSEILFVFQWINPAAHLMKNAIRINLEFMADHEVIRLYPDIENYQMAMVRLADRKPAVVLANALHVSQLKNRIIMMKRIDFNRYPVLKKLAIVPLTLIMVLLISGKQFNYSASAKDVILIKGKVVSAGDHKPLINAVVSIKNKSVGTITDNDGNFTLRIDQTDKVLVFSQTGYEKKEVEIKNKKIINVSLNKMDSKSSTVIKDEYDTAKYMTGMGYTDSLTGTLRMEAKQAAPYGEFIVKGQVSSATDKKYLSGISVIIKGKTIGTISDVNGNYMIRVSKTDKILIFIAKGYGSKEVEISGPGDINVELNPLK